MSRMGRQTFFYTRSPRVAARTSIAGPKEAQGPLARYFDVLTEDDLLGMKSWELAEGEMVRRAADRTLRAAGIEMPDVFLSGDLNNQIFASSIAARAIAAPFLGQYGACSTFIQNLVLGAALVDGGFAKSALCCASSHFCTAERQFRFPLEMGTQRPPQASWTATACGCALLTEGGAPKLKITHGTIGRVVDMGIKDANHMGAAMAPAAFDTIAAHFEDTGRSFGDYDLVATGDLGAIGRELLIELFAKSGVSVPRDRLIDCGMELYAPEQDAHAGGSGCGCVAAVSCGYLMELLSRGAARRILIAGTGALLSSTSTLQGESIPSISCAVCIERES